MIVQVKQIDFHDLNPLPKVILLDPIPYALRYGIVKMSLGKYYIAQKHQANFFLQQKYEHCIELSYKDSWQTWER